MPEGLNQFLTANHLTLTNYPLQKNELTLKEGERAVLGYFTGPYNAKQAQKTIKDMGFEIAELEPFKPSHLPNITRMLPILLCLR